MSTSVSPGGRTIINFTTWTTAKCTAVGCGRSELQTCVHLIHGKDNDPLLN